MRNKMREIDFMTFRRTFRVLILLGTGFFVQSCLPKAAVEHDNAELNRLINERESRIEFCYDNAKAANPKLKGSLTIRADHNPDGSLSYIMLHKGFPGSQSLFECIKQEMVSWKTQSPQTRGPLEMTWNFK